MADYEYIGCYNDRPIRAIPNFQGNVTTKEDCQNIAFNKKHNVYGLQYGGQCFTGTDINMAKSYGQEDKSKCGNLGGTWNQHVYYTDPKNIPGYQGSFDLIGCYNDKSQRAIPNFRGNIKNIDDCQQIAISNGDNVFGVQYGGQCFTGRNLNDAKKYGSASSNPMDRTKCGNLGGTWTQNVYYTDPSKVPKSTMTKQELQCYKDNYPDLSGLDTDEKLQNHWNTTGFYENRNNKCPGIQTSSGDYKYMGCFNDKPERAITNFQGNVNNIDECRHIAHKKRHTIFGVQNGGECYTGNDYNNSIKYSQVFDGSKCPPNGGVWTNQIYKKDKPFKPLPPPIPILSNANFSDS